MCFISVMFAFEQSLLCFAYHPDMWYEAAAYLENTGRDLIERGVNKHCVGESSMTPYWNIILQITLLLPFWDLLHWELIKSSFTVSFFLLPYNTIYLWSRFFMFYLFNFIYASLIISSRTKALENMRKMKWQWLLQHFTMF